MNIAVIVGTTRNGRMTPRLAKWVMNGASKRTDANFTLLDLAEYDIPMLAEAPWEENRTLTDGARAWLDALKAADGLIVVTAEYNHTIPAVLKNAFDYTNGQLKRKPVAIVSHGVNSGVRANEHLRQMFNSLMDAFTISATVTFYGQVGQLLDEGGNATGANELNDQKLHHMLDEIVWYTSAITTAKQSNT